MKNTIIMSSKSRKSLSPWVTCEKCTCTISQKDVPIHESQCPPSSMEWNHNYIRNSILYSTIEIYATQELPKNITERNTHDMIFMSQSALQLCQIAIGDRVVIVFQNGAIIKTAWPMGDKCLTSVCLAKNTIEIYQINGRVRVKKSNTTLPLAKEIEIQCESKLFKAKLPSELLVLLKNSNERKAFTVDNRISLSYYGKKLAFKIKKIVGEKDNYESIEDIVDKMSIEEEKGYKFYEALYWTKWIITRQDQEMEKKNCQKEQLGPSLEDIGGYQQLVEDLRDLMNISFKKTGKHLRGFKPSKGILLYGTAGVGKSAIITAILSEYNVQVFSINDSNINNNKSFDNYERRIEEIFTDAKSHTPSVILIEDIDSLCSRKFGAGTASEKRILGTLIKEIDDLQRNNIDTILFATSSKPDFIDPSLRRPGRIDREFEVSAPTRQMRREILLKFLSKIPHTITREELDKIAFTTHGFVGADLYGLCSQAAMCTIKRHQKNTNSDCHDEIEITGDDFDQALTMVKPSAMKEVLVEIPNVMWSEIGGQQGLKLKLQQAVEWPLRHPDVFVRLGITPPRGVLMFGPPGCSKTMIARALATESKLNFINIKGPELFSKWVGESERAVREVFRKARQVAPSIVFIDEIDAIGGERASGSNSANSGNNVQERVLAQLLTELDGVTSLGNVTLVAATNRPDRIDKALLRPGRLDRIVYVPLPDYETRLEIFEIKFRKMPISEDVNIIDLVELTEGYSGAEVQAICHEAAMKALEDNFDATTITKEHFKAALSIVSPRTPPSLIKLYEDYINNM